MRIHELFAYLRVKDAVNAIQFYEKAFGAKEKFRLSEPNGRIGHAELDFDGFTVLLSDEFPEYDVKGPQTIGATSVQIHLHVDNADEVVTGAIACGAEIVRKPQDMFWGERLAVVRDPFGHEWIIGHSLEQLTPEEMQGRYTDIITNSKKT